MSLYSPTHRAPLETFIIFLKLGLISFGGPVAHLGYFRQEFVERHRWLSDKDYAELIALCQLLPGPASSQVGFALGFLRSGFLGGLCAWLGFTLPSAIFLILFAVGLRHFGDLLPNGFVDGLKLLALAVVTQAVWIMARKLCPDGPRLGLMLGSALILVLAMQPQIQLVVILVGGLAGLMIYRRDRQDMSEPMSCFKLSPKYLFLLPLFFLLLFILPVLAHSYPDKWLQICNIFYQTGALVFGGGHVVLPLLENQVVREDWLSAEQFLAGYGGAQAVPGPLFSFAAYLGAALGTGVNSAVLALVGLVAIFLPGFLLLLGVMPLWGVLRGNPRVQAALKGVNAVVVGLLLAALYDPLIPASIHGPVDAGIAAILITLIMRFKVSVLIVLTISLILKMLHLFLMA